MDVPYKKLNIDVRYDILKILRHEAAGYTTEGLAETLFIGVKHVRRALASLQADGMVKTIQDAEKKYYLDSYILEQMKADLVQEKYSPFNKDDLSYIR